MRVAVVGGGTSGRAIERALLDRGSDVELMSRSTGFNVICDNAARRLAGFDAIIEATGRFTLNARTATDFFTRSTRAVARAANATGARHVLLSIVNCELPEVQGYGYFAGKAAQERVAQAESENLIVVRSTHWFDFPAQSLQRLRLGPLAAVPTMRIRPVALSAVAEVLAECALGERTGSRHDLAGPEELTLWEMTRQVPDSSARLVPLPMPGRLGRAFRDGTLAPTDGVEIVGPSYEQWLRAGARTGQS